jgi:hypothetical protein
MAHSLLPEPKLYLASLADAIETYKLQGSLRHRGRHLLLQQRDLERMVEDVRPPPIPPPPTAPAAHAASGLQPYRSAAPPSALALQRKLLMQSAQSLPGRLFTVGSLGGGGGSMGRSGGGVRSGGGSGTHTRQTPVLPNIQRCGECRTCMNRSLKKACIRNKVGFAVVSYWRTASLPPSIAALFLVTHCVPAITKLIATTTKSNPNPQAIRAEVMKVASGIHGPSPLLSGIVPPQALLAAAAAARPDAAAAAAAAAGDDPSAADAHLKRMVVVAPSAEGGAGSMDALMSVVAARGLKMEVREGAISLKLPGSRAPQVRGWVRLVGRWGGAEVHVVC